MNVRFMAARLRKTLTLLLLTVCMGSTLARADEPPFIVNLDFDKGAVMLGEPIVLNFELINISAQTITVIWGEHRDNWLTLELSDKTGRPVALASDFRPRNIETFSLADELKPEGVHKGSIVVSQWVVPPKPGTYFLRARVRLRYRTHQEPVRFEVLSQERSIPLQVTKPDVQRLREIAEILRTAALREVGVITYRQALECLFSMPEAVALPVWRTLINDPVLAKMNVDRGAYVIEQLTRLGTSTAIILLAEMWGNKNTPHRYLGAKGALENLYRSGDLSLRPHIQKIFASRGERLPKLPGPNDPPQIDID